MELVQAYAIIGIPETSTPDEIIEAYAKLRASYEVAVYRANSDEIRQKNMDLLKELEIARQSLVPDFHPTPLPFNIHTQNTPPPAGHQSSGYGETPLTNTQYLDLPTPSPHLTGFSDFQQTPGTPVSGATGATGIKPGQVLQNRYEVRRQIGAGGMGEVYEAYDRVGAREVALKLLLPLFAKVPKARERFATEARLSINLSHPNIANVHEVQQDGELCFMTMELLKGRTLRQEMLAKADVRAQFSAQEVVALAKPLCEALAYAHRTTVHRDIKPENIWVGQDGTIKIMDFGIAQVMTPTRMTQTAMSVGTVLYMAPEQMQNAKDVDHRADQYSLAVVLYEMLTGKLPTGRAKPVAELRVDVPATLSRAIDRALQTAPQDRFADMTAFESALAKKGASAASKKKTILLAALLGVLAVAALITFHRPSRQNVVNRILPPDPPSLMEPVSFTHDSVHLKWKGATPERIKGYIIERTAVGKDEAVQFEVAAKVTETTDTRDIKPDSSYQYKIVAVGQAGNSDPSQTREVTTKPSAPGEVASGKFNDVSDPTTEILFTWLPAAQGVSQQVERREEGSDEWNPMQASEEQLMTGKYHDKGLKPDTQYFYRVVTSNRGGKTSGKVMDRFTDPVAPAGLDAKPTEDGKVEVTWGEKLKPGRKLMLQIDKTNPVQLSKDEADSGKWIDDSVEPGENRTYKLSVRTPLDASSKPAEKTIALPPSQPKGLKIVSEPNPNQVQLEWDGGQKGVQEFVLQRKEGDGQFVDIPQKIDGDTDEVADSKLTAGKEYTYRLVAKNSGGGSRPSEPTAVFRAIFPEPKLPKVIAKSRDNGKKQIQIHWEVSDPKDVLGLDKITLERAEAIDGAYTEIRSFHPAVSGDFADEDQALQHGQDYFYRVLLHSPYYQRPVVGLFQEPVVIPKIQAVVVPAPAPAAGNGGGPAAKGGAQRGALILGVPQPTPTLYRELNTDKELKGLSTPTPPPSAKQ